jgi:putative addiction module component (TIGR02574 family)
MSAAERVISEALALPLPERAKVVHRLLESLESVADDQLDATWLAELESRADQVEKGAVTPIPWDAARDSITSELNKRRAARSSS